MGPKRGRRPSKIVMKEIATQTDVSPTTKIFTRCLQPMVLVQQVDPQQHLAKKTISSQSKSSPNEKTMENSSKALNVPNYSVFARPITNKENASSTLVTQDHLRRQESLFNNKITTRAQKRVKFVKPGPLCFKKKFFNNDSLSIPVMLGQEQNESLRRNLDTIIEKNTENTPSLNLSEELIDVAMKEIGIQTLQSCDLILNEENTGLDDILSGTPMGTSSPINKAPENIRLDFEGVTTIISTRSDKKGDENSDSDSSDDNVEENREDLKSAKCIKIKASTVHIHNHFYKA